MQSPDLPFVQLKIAEIRTAIFFYGKNAILPLPAHIVSAIKPNESDIVRFFISKSWDNNEFHQGFFPGKLEFYNRGYPFTLKIQGAAKLIPNKTDMQDLIAVPLIKEVYNRLLLVSVKIQRIEYKELISARTFNAFKIVIFILKGMLYALPGRKSNTVVWQPSV